MNLHAKLGTSSRSILSLRSWSWTTNIGSMWRHPDVLGIRYPHIWKDSTLKLKYLVSQIHLKHYHCLKMYQNQPVLSQTDLVLHIIQGRVADMERLADTSINAAKKAVERNIPDSSIFVHKRLRGKLADFDTLKTLKPLSIVPDSNVGKQKQTQKLEGVRIDGANAPPRSSIINTGPVSDPLPCSPEVASVFDSSKFDKIIRSRVSERIEHWKHELEFDTNAKFLLEGLSNGFNIIDGEIPTKPTFKSNYRSALNNKEKVESKILHEIKVGNYVLTETKPTIVSSLGAVPKGKDDVRIIHDLSRPDGGINKLAWNTSVSYTSVDIVTEHISNDSYLATVDLRAAYRSIPINNSCFELTGLSWKFQNDNHRTYLFDTRLPFGAAKSCSIFQSITDSICRMMRRRGFHIFAYLDDIICVGNSYSNCLDCYETLIALIDKLGLVVNWSKACAPVKKLFSWVLSLTVSHEH